MTASWPRVAVDLSGLQAGDVPPSHLKYTLEFVRALERSLPPGHLMTLADWRRRVPGVDPVALGGTRLQRGPGTVDALLEMPDLVYHVGRLDLTAPTIPMRLVSSGVPTTASVLGPAVHAKDRHPMAQSRQDALVAVLRTFDLVLAPSDWLGSLLRQQCHLESRRLVNIGVGCHPVAPVLDARLSHALFGETQPHVIVAGAGELERPNSEALLRAVAQLPGRIRVGTKVVLLGRRSAVRRRRLQCLTRELGLADNQVVFAGEPDPATAATWVQAATLFVHLSSDDGIGIAALEAAAAGAPVLVADAGALPSLFDWEPARVDPGNAAALARRIELVLSDPDFGDELRAHCRQRAVAHPWDAVAQKAISAMSGLRRPAGRAGAPRHPRRRRLALVGAFDTRSLAGAFNTRLAQALSMEASVDAFGSSHHPDAGGGAARRWPRAALGKVLDIADFDAVIYVLADDDGHAPILEAHLAAPGSLLLLNDSLASAYVGIARRHGPARVHASLARCYAEPTTVISDDGTNLAASVFHDHGLRMMGEAARSADHVLVLDPTTAEGVRADLGWPDERGLTVLPVPSPEVGGGPEEPGRRNGILVIGSIERVTDVLPALAAMAHVPALRAVEVRVTPVTGGGPDVGPSVARAAWQLGLRRVHALAGLGLPELRLALAHSRGVVLLTGRRTEPLLLAEAQAAGTPVAWSSSMAPEAFGITNLVDALTDDECWISAHRTVLEQAPSTKMEEIVDIILSTLPWGR